MLEVLKGIFPSVKTRNKEQGLSLKTLSSEVLGEVARKREGKSPVLADDEIDWETVAIGISPGYLKSLYLIIKTMAEAMRVYGLRIFLLVAKETLELQNLPENVEVANVEVEERATMNWLRDRYLPINGGLIAQPGPRFSFSTRDTLIRKFPNLQIEEYGGISTLRGGDLIITGDKILVGGITWNWLLNQFRNIGKAEDFLKKFCGKKEVLVLPWRQINEEDVPIPCIDLDSFVTGLGENIVLVGEEKEPFKAPKTFWFLEQVAETLEKSGFEVFRLPFLGRKGINYNNCLIHGPKRLVFIPKYGEEDQWFFQADEVYRQVGFTPFGIPFFASFSQRNYGQIRCLTLPIPRQLK